MLLSWLAARLRGGIHLTAGEDNQAFEREKWVDERALREREVTVKEREQVVREEDLNVRKAEIARAGWRNPLMVAILAGALAVAGNGLVAWLNGWQGRQLEETRAESARILEMIKTGDADKAAENLRFLADAGLVSDPQRLAAIRHFLSIRSPGQGPSLPSPSGSSGEPAPRTPRRSNTEIGILQILNLTVIPDFTKAINQGYVIAEQWPAMLKDNKVTLLSQISIFKNLLEEATSRLANLKTQYPNSNIAAAISCSHLNELVAATDDFSHAVESLPEPIPTNYEGKVLPYSGALKIQLDAARDWDIEVQHTVANNLQKSSTP